MQNKCTIIKHDQNSFQSKLTMITKNAEACTKFNFPSVISVDWCAKAIHLSDNSNKFTPLHIHNSKHFAQLLKPPLNSIQLHIAIEIRRRSRKLVRSFEDSRFKLRLIDREVTSSIVYEGSKHEGNFSLLQIYRSLWLIIGLGFQCWKCVPKKESIGLPQMQLHNYRFCFISPRYNQIKTVRRPHVYISDAPRVTSS